VTIPDAALGDLNGDATPAQVAERLPESDAT
jgi:hypothetical protein